MNSKIPKFQIGFWHPFGPHAGETADFWNQFPRTFLDNFIELSEIAPI